jgi:glycosyltransferase involved in cell wall biosynthesis
VPLVVPWRGQPLDPLGTPPPSVLFVGYYRHPPNADAARWLVDEIFPRVRAECPGARLVLAGAELPPDVAASAGDGVQVAGPVADLEAELERAAVVVAPLRSGGGARVKVLEALGAGKAVVATPLAVEGIEVPTGEVLRVASSTDDLVREIVALLRDSELRSRLGAAAYAWAGKELDGRRTADSYEQIYADVRSRK